MMPHQQFNEMCRRVCFIATGALVFLWSSCSAADTSFERASAALTHKDTQQEAFASLRQGEQSVRHAVEQTFSQIGSFFSTSNAGETVFSWRERPLLPGLAGSSYPGNVQAFLSQGYDGINRTAYSSGHVSGLPGHGSPYPLTLEEVASIRTQIIDDRKSPEDVIFNNR